MSQANRFLQNFLQHRKALGPGSYLRPKYCSSFAICSSLILLPGRNEVQFQYIACSLAATSQGGITRRRGIGPIPQAAVPLVLVLRDGGFPRHTQKKRRRGNTETYPPGTPQERTPFFQIVDTIHCISSSFAFLPKRLNLIFDYHSENQIIITQILLYG